MIIPGRGHSPFLFLYDTMMSCITTYVSIHIYYFEREVEHTLLPYILVIAIALFGGIATLVIGNSKANQTSNPDYDRKTKQNLSRLSYVYVFAIVFGVGGLILYLVN